MKLAIDELERCLKYHTRQLEENLTEIQRKEESILLLKSTSEKEQEIIEHLQQAIDLIKMDMELSPSIPTEKQPTDSITEVQENDNLLPIE